MPLIEYSTLPDMTDEKKIEMINALVETASRVTEKPKEFFTVLIREVSGAEAYGHTGKPATVLLNKSKPKE